MKINQGLKAYRVRLPSKDHGTTATAANGRDFYAVTDGALYVIAGNAAAVTLQFPQAELIEEIGHGFILLDPLQRPYTKGLESNPEAPDGAGCSNCLSGQGEPYDYRCESCFRSPDHPGTGDGWREAKQEAQDA